MADDQTATAQEMTPDVVGDADPSGLTRPGELHFNIGKSPTVDAKANIGGNKADLLAEAYKRGLLPDDKKALYEEAMKRRLVSVPDVSLGDAAKDPMQTGEVIVSQAQRNFEQRVQTAKKRYLLAQGYPQDIDPDERLSFGDKMALEQADNPEEKRLYLSNKYGKQNVFPETGDPKWIVSGGKKIPITGGILPSAAGMAPELLGGGVGAALGAAVGGPPGAIAGAGLGTALGKADVEAFKGLEGRSNKNLGETTQAIGKEGIAGMAGEAAGRPIAAGISRLTKGPLPSALTGATPEIREMTALSLRGGAVPPTKSALPNSRRIQWHQALSEKTVGPFSSQEDANRAFIDNEIKNVLRESGIPEGKINEVFSSIVDPKAAVSSRELGEDIQKSIKAYRDTLESASAHEMDVANAQLDKQLGQLNALTKRFQPGDLGVDVASGIVHARRDFATAANKVYGRVDKLVGDDPLVPTAAIKKEAESVLGSLPKNEKGEVVLGNAQLLAGINDLKSLPDYMSFKDAQQIRSTLRDLGEMRDLVPPSSTRQFNKLKQSVETAFSLAQSDPKAAAGVKMLRAADKFYSDGIKKFNDATINQIVRQAENGLPVDPAKVASMVIKPGYQARVETIKKMLPADTWRRVAGADFDNMVSDSTRTIDGKDVVKGKMLKAEIDKRSNLLDVTYGPRTANIIREYANRLAARDGELPAANLTADNFSAAMMRSEAATKTLNEFMEKNYLSALANPTKMPDDVLKWIVKPEQEERLAQAVKFFGEKSPQVSALRQAALRDLMSRAITNTESGVSRTVQGAGLENALREYTAAQQDMLFPNGLADDIRLVAKEARFLYPQTESDMSAGLAAGAIKAMPLPVYAVAAMYSGFWGFVLSRPGVVKALALGLSGDGAIRAAAKQSIRTMAQAAALGTVPTTPGSAVGMSDLPPGSVSVPIPAQGQQ